MGAVRSTAVRFLGRRGSEQGSPGASSATPVEGSAAAPTSAAADDETEFETSCRAPFTSMYFDQLGDVRSCCWNISAPLGNIRKSTIREIWDGAQNGRLRAAVREGDFSQGCSFCAWQRSHGDDSTRVTERFDDLPLSGPVPRWPVELEFALTNRCNLQCQMCTGWNSSAIRAQREQLPPLPEVYGEEFFEELTEFLPKVQRVHLLGGEPFLCRSSLRVLEMIAVLEEKPMVSVTTNGTLWSPRIERICDAVPMTFSLSLDAVSPELYRSIRVGAELAPVLENLDRYRSLARRHGTQVGLTMCLMSNNTGDFGGLLRLAEDRELDFVYVNVVTLPGDFSLYGLEPVDLEARVSEMEASLDAAALTRPDLVRVGLDHVDNFRRRLAEHERGDERAGSQPLAAVWAEDSELVERCAEWVREWSGEEPTVLRGNGRLVVTEIAGPLLERLQVGPQDVVDRPMQYVGELLGAQAGVHLSPTDPASEFSNEVSLAGEVGLRRLEVRSFLFADGPALVALFGARLLETG